MVAGSLTVIGSQSPVVPTLSTPEDKILSRLDSAFSEKGKRANNATKNNYFIFFYLTYLRSKCDYNLDALSFIHANKCSENERLTNKLTSFLF